MNSVDFHQVKKNVKVDVDTLKFVGIDATMTASAKTSNIFVTVRNVTDEVWNTIQDQLESGEFTKVGYIRK